MLRGEGHRRRAQVMTLPSHVVHRIIEVQLGGGPSMQSPKGCAPSQLRKGPHAPIPGLAWPAVALGTSHRRSDVR